MVMMGTIGAFFAFGHTAGQVTQISSSALLSYPGYMRLLNTRATSLQTRIDAAIAARAMQITKLSSFTKIYEGLSAARSRFTSLEQAIRFEEFVASRSRETLQEMESKPESLKALEEEYLRDPEILDTFTKDPAKFEEWLGEIGKDGLGKTIKDLPEAIRDIVSQFPDDAKANFLKDYFDEASAEFRSVLSEKPYLVDAWKVLGESADLRKNIDALETIEYYTKNVNGNIDELTDAFKAASNKEDWFSDIITQIRAKARNLPGTSKGNGVVIEGQWMRGTEGNLGLFPKQIADKLKGRNFKNFAEFRSEFWKAVADDPDLAKQFSPGNQGAMKNGFAPTPSENQWLRGRDTYEIHHKTPIHDGGEVYDMDNLVIVTPRYHKEILDPAYHFNK